MITYVHTFCKKLQRFIKFHGSKKLKKCFWSFVQISLSRLVGLTPSDLGQLVHKSEEASVVKLFGKIKVRCHCGAILKVHPSEIKTTHKSSPIMVDGDMGEWCAGEFTNVRKTCTCPCSRQETVVVSEYSSGGYNTSPGGYSNVVD